MLTQARFIRFYGFLVFGVLFSAVGCGEPIPDGLPTLHPTTITVTSEGKPLEKVIIALRPADGSNSQWTSGATTDETGTAVVFTHGQYRGAPEGKYKVLLTRTISEGEAPPTPGLDAESRKAYDEYKASGKTLKRFHTIDKKFNDIKETPLEITIISGENAETFEVGPEVRNEITTRSLIQ